VALYRLGPDRYRDIALIAWAEARAGAEDARWRALLDLPERWTPPGFPIGGEDLLRLGIGKGPPVGEILRRLEADWIAGGFAASRADLIEAARKLAGRGGGSSG
jgi:poly(A) polymerase